MISHEGGVSDDVIKYPKIWELTHNISCLAVFLFCLKGAYGISYVPMLRLDLYVRYFITDTLFMKYFEMQFENTENFEVQFKQSLK